MRTKTDKVRALADRLLGTTDPLPDWALDDQDVCLELDLLIWLCTGCGWWCEVSEMEADEYEDEYCEDCRD